MKLLVKFRLVEEPLRIGRPVSRTSPVRVTVPLQYLSEHCSVPRCSTEHKPNTSPVHVSVPLQYLSEHCSVPYAVQNTNPPLLLYMCQYRYSISVSTVQYHDAIQSTNPTINACRLATNSSLFQSAVQLYDWLFGTVTGSVPLTTDTQYPPAHPPRSKQPWSGAGR